MKHLIWILLISVFSPALGFSATPTERTVAPTRARENPNVGVDFLLGWAQFNRESPLIFEGGHDPKLNGFNIQQLELSYTANVDPYFKGEAYLVLVPEGGELKLELEEAYGTTLALPLNLQARIGKFYTAFGRNNQLHPHSWSFADRPLVIGRMFGGDGLRNPGLQVSWLTPLPFYSELILSTQDATGETAASFIPEGVQRSAADYLYNARWANFLEFSRSASAVAGLSLATGPNPQGRTHVYGADLYLKLRDPAGLSFWSIQAEALKRYYANESDFGYYVELLHRLGGRYSRWHVGARYDYVGDKPVPVQTAGEEGEPDPDISKRYRIAPNVTYYPSEFSKIRVQYDYDKPTDFEAPQHAVFVQYEFILGPHAGHTF